MSTQIAWKPNWIDYRTSVANVGRREDRGEAVAEIPTCPECRCETDVVPVPHSPKCSTLAADEPRRRPGDGLELLERMDRGEPVADDDDDVDGPADAELEETADAGSMGRTAVAVSSSPEEDGLEETSGARPTTPEPSRAAAEGPGPPAGVGRLLEPAGSPPGPADDAASPQEARRSPLVDGDGGASTKLGRGESQRAVLAALVEGYTTSGAIAAERISSSPSQVSATLRVLVDKGLASRVKFGVYEPTDEGREAIASGATLDARHNKSGREPRAFDDASAGASRNEQPPSRPDTHPLKVPGTGLCYRNALEAFAAADEVEHDGERVARSARDDGDEGRADQAIDAARALAEDIRGAARVFEDRQNGATQPAADDDEQAEPPAASDPEPEAELEPEPEPVRGRGGRRPTWTREDAIAKLIAESVDGVAPARAAFLLSGISNAVVVRLFGSYTNMVTDAGLTSILAARYKEPLPRLMVTPEEMAPFQRSLVLALVAGMRAAADALEQELDG